MRRWSLYVDESGDFAAQPTSLVAGVLVDAPWSADLHRRMRRALERAAACVAWPPHAWTLNSPDNLRKAVDERDAVPSSGLARALARADENAVRDALADARGALRRALAGLPEAAGAPVYVVGAMSDRTAMLRPARYGQLRADGYLEALAATFARVALFLRDGPTIVDCFVANRDVMVDALDVTSAPESTWARLDALRRPLRLKLLAHAVQGVNDAAQEPWRDVAARAFEALNRPGDEDEGDARVLGALGRLHAAWGEWEVARDRLLRALDTWVALHRADEASFAVCELLRVEGIRGTTGEVERALAYARRCHAHDGTTAISQSYLDLACGRALVQLGLRVGDTSRVSAGVERLGDCRPGGVLLGARRRWRAIAGDDAALAALEADPDARVDATLARMARGEAPESWRAVLVERQGRDLLRSERVLGPDATPDQIAATWRY